MDEKFYICVKIFIYGRKISRYQEIQPLGFR